MSTQQRPLDRLWEPVQIGPVSIRNRIAHGPSTLLFAQENILSDRHIAYYAERAMGGTGLIITEEHAAYRSGLGAFPDSCTAFDPRAVPAFARLAQTLHEHGARGFVQLWGPGLEDSGTVMPERWQPVMAVSRSPSPGHNAIPMVMGIEQIAEVVRGHGASARNAEVAGLDGVEVHAAHGWLVKQFLSPLFNDRRDGYGGSLQGRMRLLTEILEEIHARAGALAVGVQLSVDEYVGELGITPEETLAQVQALAHSGLADYVNISTGSQYSRGYTIAAMEHPEALLADHGRAVKQVAGERMKVLVIDTVRTAAAAARLVAEEAADIVGMTRAHIADPFLVAKAMSGREAETIPCVGENECILRTRRARPVACLMNPTSGRERRWGTRASAVSPASRPLRIAIVGGGPAGLHVAGVLASRDHRIVLFEREEHLGGHLHLLAGLPGRERWQVGIDALAAAARRAGAELRVGVEAGVEDLAALAPDRVLCATGSTWDRTGVSFARADHSPIPGVESDRVLGADQAIRRALAQPGSLGARVVVVDETGEHLPLGIADLLSGQGAAVEIVTRHPQVGEAAISSLDAGGALGRMRERAVEMWPGHLLSAIDGATVRVTEAWSQRDRAIENVDTVVLSMLRSPERRLLEQALSAGLKARALGDALTPRRTAEVIYEAEEVGRELGVEPGLTAAAEQAVGHAAGRAAGQVLSA